MREKERQKERETEGVGMWSPIKSYRQIEICIDGHIM